MSLDLSYDSQNVFAKIISGDIPCAKIAEDDLTLAIMDAFPQSEGHALVIPKQDQATNLLTASPETLAAVIQQAQVIAAAIRKALNPDGIRIVQFNGEAAGQTVFHLHFHVIPIWKNKRLSAHGGAPAPMEDLKVIAQKISAEIS